MISRCSWLNNAGSAGAILPAWGGRGSVGFAGFVVVQKLDRVKAGLWVGGL